MKRPWWWASPWVWAGALYWNLWLVRKARLRRAWYRWRYDVQVPPSMFPKLGCGKYVDVVRHGPFVEITDHREGGTIRLIPYQPNHGLMLEFWLDGAMRWRTHLDYAALKAHGMNQRERA